MCMLCRVLLSQTTVNIKCNKNCKRVTVKNKNVFLAINQLIQYNIYYFICSDYE